MPRGVTTSAAGRSSGRPRRGNCRSPAPISAAGGAYRGAILGLDVVLADFSLVRTSTKPLPRKPSVSDADRREFVESVPLVDPSGLTDSDRDAIVAAMQNGRTRMKLVRTPAEVAAVADVAGLSALERTLLAWALEHDPNRAASFFSPSQLLWLGLAQTRVAALDAWGTSAESRRGCLCLQFADAWTWERVAGRTTAGMSASAFPDLNLRLAELLSQLHMPAALLAPVLTAAMLDFVDLAISRDGDDRRGLVEFVQALRPETVEQYLALLTTGGALVPVEEPAKTGHR